MWAKLHAICKNASVNTKTPLNSPNLPDISVQTPIIRSLGKSSLPLIPGPYMASSIIGAKLLTDLNKQIQAFSLLGGEGRGLLRGKKDRDDRQKSKKTNLKNTKP